MFGTHPLRDEHASRTTDYARRQKEAREARETEHARMCDKVKRGDITMCAAMKELHHIYRRINDRAMGRDGAHD
jgi:hypothetical protein